MGAFLQGLIAVLFVATATALVASPAFAQTQQQFDWCNGKNNPTPDLQISSCIAVIQSGKITGTDLALAFNNRGSAYRRSGQVDRAMQDFDNAIRYDHNFAGPYYNRGLIYFNRGEFALAISQFDASLKNQPKYPAALYSRGLAKHKKGDVEAGNADIRAAKAIDGNIGDVMAKFGIKP